MLGVCAAGCGRPSPPASPLSPSPKPSPPVSAAPLGPPSLRLTDVTETAGVRFRHHNGAFGRKWFPEINGSGAAIFDYNGDGFPDLFLINSRDWTAVERKAAGAPPPGKSVATPSRLYRNRGDGTFEDVTRGSGLELPMYGMGCAVGDYDNDGDPDLYVTGVGRSWLFRNEGGRFTEVAEAADVAGKGWATGCAWVDVNRDGRLDLFVCHYVDWKASEDVPCSGADDRPVYCGPNLYPPEPCHLFLQNPDGRFRDVSKAAGIWGTAGRPLTSKALGVVSGDFNGDQWPDLAVANDTEANFLFRNNRNGTFTEEALRRGAALAKDGSARSGMGIDSGDWDGSGREGLLVGNFVEEMLALLRPTGPLFNDVADATGVGAASRPFTTFGCLFTDLNNDGWLDIVAANGHIDDKMERGSAVPLRQRPLFLINHGGKRFEEQVLEPRAIIGRGLAAGDIDRDGDADLLITANGGAPLLLRNEQRGQRSLRLVLEGVKSNRSAIGAEVVAKVGQRVIRRRVKSGSSFLSASELPLTVGLGSAAAAQVTVLWPSGARQSLGALTAGSEYTVVEGAGVRGTVRLREGK